MGIATTKSYAVRAYIDYFKITPIKRRAMFFSNPLRAAQICKTLTDFVTSDTIRQRLTDLGIQLKDEKDGGMSYSC